MAVFPARITHHEILHPKGWFRHHRECRRLRCALHADRLWGHRRAIRLRALRRKREAEEAREYSGSGGGSHMRCIIEHESGGNPQAVNGKYEGIGQWEPSSWAHYGGLRYASSPLGASKAEQEAVLAGEGDAGMSQSQGQYDGCG